MPNNDFEKPNGWNEWSRYVLKTLESLNQRSEAIEEKIAQNKADLLKDLNDIRVDIIKQLTEVRTSELGSLKSDITALKIKSGLWGAVAGAIPAIAAVIFILIKSLL